MDLKNFKFNKNNFDFKKIKDSFWEFLLNRFGFIFMSIFIVAAGISGFIIYKHMYNSDWSEDQKNVYRMQVESSKIPFDEDKFNNVIDKINERKELKNNNITISRDIFGTTE